MTSAQSLIDTSVLVRLAADLVVAATAELFGLTLLHHDGDFATIASVTVAAPALVWRGLTTGRKTARVTDW